VRRYIEERRTAPAKSGQPLDSHTLHGHVRAIRAWLHWAAAEELLDDKVAKRIALPKREQKVLAVLTSEQVTRLFRAAEAGESAALVARDKALLAVLFDCGIRAGELCTLSLDAVHFTADDAYLLVKGKGRKQREVPLGSKSRGLLHRYIHRARPRSEHALVFVAKGGGALTPEGLDRLLYRLRDRAGVEHFTGVRVNAHRCRHTYAVRSLEAGMDVYQLSRLMGHSSVAVTEGYLKAYTSRQARRHAVSVLDGLRREA
jgi:site-specific recombinase XerD